MADARQSHDKSKKTSTQGASSMMVNQVKSQKTINVKCFIILSKTTLTLLWFFDALLRQVMPVGESKKMKRRGSRKSGGANGREENGDKRKGEKHMKGEKCDKFKKIGLAHNLTIISVR